MRKHSKRSRLWGVFLDYFIVFFEGYWIGRIAERKRSRRLIDNLVKEDSEWHF